MKQDYRYLCEIVLLKSDGQSFEKKKNSQGTAFCIAAFHLETTLRLSPQS